MTRKTKNRLIWGVFVASLLLTLLASSSAITMRGISLTLSWPIMLLIAFGLWGAIKLTRDEKAK